MSTPDQLPADPSLSTTDVSYVVRLLEAMGVADADLTAILTVSNQDKLIDQIFRDEVHVQRT